MKVLHIGEYVKGGVATYLREVVSYQMQSEEISEVDLVLSNQSERDFPISNDHIFYYKYKRESKYFFKTIAYINRKIKDIKPDIIHVHSTYAGFYVRILSFLRKRKYKIVYCSHGWAFLMEAPSYKKKIYAMVERVLAVNTDKIINISYYEQSKAIGMGIPEQKCVLVNNGEKKEVNYRDVQLHLDESKLNLLFVGRFDQQKGLDILLDFFTKYKYNHIQLYLAGDKVLNKEEIHIPNNCIQLGWIENHLIPSYYRLFDAVIIPSRWEGFGLVAIEAMRSKKAIIVSDRGALPDLANHDNGYIFELDNLDTLQTILDTITKKDLKQKGLNGYKYFCTNFTSDLMNKGIMEVYRELV